MKDQQIGFGNNKQGDFGLLNQENYANFEGAIY